MEDLGGFTGADPEPGVEGVCGVGGEVSLRVRE